MMSKLSGAPKGLASRGPFKIVDGNECPVAKEVTPICLRDHIQCRDQLGEGIIGYDIQAIASSSTSSSQGRHLRLEFKKTFRQDRYQL